VGVGLLGVPSSGRGMKACSSMDLLPLNVDRRGAGAPFWSMLWPPPIPGERADTPSECGSRAPAIEG